MWVGQMEAASGWCSAEVQCLEHWRHAQASDLQISVFLPVCQSAQMDSQRGWLRVRLHKAAVDGELEAAPGNARNIWAMM